MGSFIREKKIYCGKKYMEVDIYSQTYVIPPQRGKRAKKKELSLKKQRNLNDKNAKRYFRLLMETNFGEGDLHVTATYKIPPATLEEGEKEATNYLRRIAYLRKKKGLPPLKYMLVTEHKTAKDGGKTIRFHHHIVINGGLSRKEVEDLWSKPRKKGEKKGKRIGYVNTDDLQPDEDDGLIALANYLSKDPKGKKRWSSSQNLEKPEYRNNDHKYSRREVEKIVRDEIDNNLFWAKKYPDWDLTECKAEYNDITGWAIYLKLRKARI